jgi:deoxyribose-phosphate aldolase
VVASRRTCRWAQHPEPRIESIESIESFERIERMERLARNVAAVGGVTTTDAIRPALAEGKQRLGASRSPAAPTGAEVKVASRR